MPTELVEGNPSSEATAGGATVDAQAFGQAMARELASFLKQDSPKAEKVDEINNAVMALRARGLEDNDIQAYITTAIAATEKSKRELEEKTKETTTKFLQYQTGRELDSAISRITRSYSKDDELVSEVASSLRQYAKEQFLNGTTTDIVNSRNRFLNGGELDEEVLDDIIAKKIQRIHEKSKGSKNSGTPSGVKNDTPPQPDKEDNKNQMSADGMSELQRTVYNSHKSTLRNHYGNSPEGLAELEKAALAAAARIKI